MERPTYKIWMTIEKCEIVNGEEVFTDIKEETASAGVFSTLDNAAKTMEEIHNVYGGDFTNN